MPVNLQERLVTAQRKRNNYRPRPEVATKVRGVTEVLGSLVGATGSGKSYIIPPVLRLGGAEFSEAGNMSSRATRPNDPANFRGNQPKLELLDRITRRNLVNYMVHNSHDIYATDADSYTTRYVLLPTLTTALPQLELSGCFGEVKPIGIVVDGNTWEKERLGDNCNNLPRMMEAVACINWLRARVGKMPILENITGEEDVTAQAIVDIMRNPDGSFPFDNLERITFILDEMAAVATRHVRRLTKP